MNVQIGSGRNRNKLGGFIERAHTGFPDFFMPGVFGAIIPADRDLYAAGYRPGSYRRGGWSQKKIDVFSKQVGHYFLWVRGTTVGPTKFWTAERTGISNDDDDQILTHAMCDLPILNRTHQAAMRLAEFCHPQAPDEQWFLQWANIVPAP
jgi:hypothetical protein